MSEDDGGMGELSRQSEEATDAVLSHKELSLLANTSVNLEAYRIHIKDSESFDKLITAVKESNRRKEDIAALKARITGLGEGVIKVAGNVAKLAVKGLA